MTEIVLPPIDEVEHMLSQLWADALARSKVGSDEDLLELGAGSLALMSVVARAQDILERDIPPEVILKTMFQQPTVRAFAYAIHSSLAASSGTPPLSDGA